jgi:long-chain acyl-CoA synthetase
MGDLLGFIKGRVVNAVVRHHKKLVPSFELPQAVRFNEALARGRRSVWVKPRVRGGDMAVLQYTGGTTGVSKGAVLLHRNVLANVRQAYAWHQPVLGDLPADEQLTSVCALPMYHIFAFTVNLVLSWETGANNILIPNPRDLPDVLKTLRKERFHSFPAVSTLFNGLVNHPDFHTVDWRHLRASVGGGMAVQSAVAQRWLQETGCPICEGYGLSETSPIASCNALTVREFNGTIGLPLPNTRMKCVDDAGHTVPVGERGEIVIQGPQLMAGYWQRPDETAKAMTADGFFRTGDIGTMDERGFFNIVDRKKDMVLVSGFNVYPNEIEDIVAQMPGVLECAVVGIPDEKTGEAVKLVVVKKDPYLTEADVLSHCRTQLTSYKRPKVVVFQDSLPKTPVGKILRRELRGA